MMKKINGMIMIYVLVFLQILTILGLACLQTGEMAVRQGQLSWRHHWIIEQSQSALNQVENLLIQSQSLPLCEIPVTASQDLAAQPLSWWRDVSCTGNFPSFQYYYVVELLGLDPCAILHVDNQTRAASYFRITLMGVTHDAKSMLQSTVALPSSESVSCSGIAHEVVQGRQMWRRVN